MKLRLCFLIRQLNEGGAQRQLIELAKRLDRGAFDVSIVTFYEGGRFEHEATQIEGLTLYCLNKRGRWDVIPFVLRLIRTLRQIRPNLLHGYLSSANLLTIPMKAMVRGMRVVWGVRSSNMDPAHYDWFTRLHYAAERLLARFADLIIINSHTAEAYHLAHGFPEKKCLVIPNGIDVTHFRRLRREEIRLRREYGISDAHVLIAIVARLDPMKDHRTFLQAAALLSQERPDARFLCVGSGPNLYTEELTDLASILGLASRVIWTGTRADMPNVYSAIDVLTLSSSFGEGFPNVVAEAMACGVPCVVTDVGDAAMVVGDTGIVIKPRDPQALVGAWRDLLAAGVTEREAARLRSRERIEREFGVDALSARTSTALTSLL